MIAATAVCGMVYAALAGQPLTIIGSTGPVLAFIAVLYKTSIRMVRQKSSKTEESQSLLCLTLLFVSWCVVCLVR